MKAKSNREESASSHADLERRRVPRVEPPRRTDSKRPTPFWSLLLPPSFRPGAHK